MTLPNITDTGVLWAGLLAGPLAWVVQLQGMFMLSAWATETRHFTPLHLVSVLCMLVAVGGIALAWRSWRTVGGWPSGGDEPPVARVRYLTVVGMMGDVLFACVIVAQWLAVVILPRTMGGG